MSVNLLSKCEDVKKEIKDLQQRIQNIEEAESSQIVRDSVRGSSSVFPYVSRSIIIEGMEEKRKAKNLKNIKKYWKKKEMSF